MTGRFTRLLPDLPGARFDQDDLEALAAAMTAPPVDERKAPASRDGHHRGSVLVSGRGGPIPPTR
jgi:hypothetical protein